jgi:hypothetical protein
VGAPAEAPPGRGAFYSRATAIAAGNQMLKDGMSLADVQAHLAADGHHGFSAETKDVQQIENEQIAQSLAPARGATYEFDLNAHGRAAALNERLPEGSAKFVESAKSWCAALQLPAGEGAALIEMIVDDGLRRERMTISEATEDAIENDRLLSYFASRRGITVDELRAKAAKVASMASPLAADSTALRNAYVVTTLAMHADSLEYANKLRGKA